MHVSVSFSIGLPVLCFKASTFSVNLNGVVFFCFLCISHKLEAGRDETHELYLIFLRTLFIRAGGLSHGKRNVN